MDPRTNKIIQDAIKEIENDPNRFENNADWIAFKKTLKEIEQAVAGKNPLVKEYINIHREAEKDPNSTIGRMAREMRKALIYSEVYRKTVGNADFASHKNELKKELEGYIDAPVFGKYRLYLEGLKYLAGMTNEVSPEVEVFFKKELDVPLLDKKSEYEKYRVGVEAYRKQENERLDKLEAEINQRFPEVEKLKQELDEKERKAGILDNKLLKVLDEEVELKKQREVLSREKEELDKEKKQFELAKQQREQEREASGRKITKEEEELEKAEQDAISGKFSKWASKNSALRAKEEMNGLKQSRFSDQIGSPERKEIMDEKKSLEAKLRDVETNREIVNKTNPPEIQQKLDEYQKAVAKIKARDMYSKQALDVFGLEDSFIGNYMERADKVTVYPYRDRETPTVICVAMMLMDGHKLEDIMNPTALLKEKKDIGQIYIQNRQAGNVEWYVKTMYDGSIAMMDAFKQYVKNHKNELKTEQDLAMHAGTLGRLSHYCFDMYQELSFCRTADDGKLYKSQDEYKKIQDILNCYVTGEGLGGKETVKYDSLMILDSDTVAIEMDRQLSIKMLLEEIQKENPDIDSAVINYEQHLSVKTQVMLMPEIKQIYGEERRIDEENISIEDIKKIASMMNSDLIKQRNMRFDHAKHPTKAIVEAKTFMGNIEKGQEMEVVVSRGGRQLVKTDVPVRVDDCFKRLESKKFRGKESRNSIEFNKMMEEYDKACGNLSYYKADKDNLEALKDLKEAAKAYIIAKRKQKGYESERMLDDKVDLVMMGKEKGGRSIFTTQGKDRYEFAVKVMANIFNIEKHYKEPEKQMENTEIKNPENNEIKQPENTEIKQPEQEINEIQDEGFGEL